ncbi:MAG: hypothetical protein NXH90_16785 [Flavobacteriaceae bacterium]|nr:hypothetical protein [Flavobacteriaceae bacterium]
MKKRISFVLLLGLVVSVSCCDYKRIYAEGEVTSVCHNNINGYDGLRISDTFQVYVHFS